MLIYKTVFSIIAMILIVVALYPYIKAIINNKISPHFFSWIIWGIATLTVFFAQLDDGGGVGSYALGFSAFTNILIAYLAYKHRKNILITPSDWVLLFIALFAIGLWWTTSTPLYSVIILSTIDFLGFLPTFKRVYQKPNSESIQFYSIIALRSALIIMALEHYSITTVLFPAVVLVMSVLLVVFILYCKKYNSLQVSST